MGRLPRVHGGTLHRRIATARAVALESRESGRANEGGSEGARERESKRVQADGAGERQVTMMPVPSKMQDAVETCPAPPCPAPFACACVAAAER